MFSVAEKKPAHALFIDQEGSLPGAEELLSEKLSNVMNL